MPDIDLADLVYAKEVSQRREFGEVLYKMKQMKRVADNLDPAKRKDIREKMREETVRKIEDRKKRRKAARDIDTYLQGENVPDEV